MSIKMIVNRICPLCGEHVAEYSVDNDSEWLLTKRSLKQYFHRSCYDKIIEHQKEQKMVKAQLRGIYKPFNGVKTDFKEEFIMKGFVDFIKNAVSYTIFVGVPIVAIGAISASAYSVGHKDGMEDILNLAVDTAKKTVEESEEKNEE